MRVLYTYSVSTLGYNFHIALFFCSQIVAQIEYFGSFDRLWRCSEGGLGSKRKVS